MDNHTRVNHALLRSYLLEFFNVQMPRTVNDFLADSAMRSKLKEVGDPDKPAINYQLSVMVKNGLLKSSKTKDGHVLENVYCSPSSSQVVPHKSHAVQPRSKHKRHIPETIHMERDQAQVTSTVQIDMADCKGVVRVGIGGFIIEVHN